MDKEYILKIYETFFDFDKLILKDLLNDFFLLENSIEKNKSKKSISYYKNKKYFDKTINLINNEIKENNLTQNEANKKISDFNKDLYGLEDLNGYKVLFFPIYKNKNFSFPYKEIDYDNLFCLRKDLIYILSDSGIIKVPNKEKISSYFTYDELKEIEPFFDILDEMVDDFEEDYGKDITEKQLKELELINKKFEIVVYKTEDIKLLIDEINKIDSKEIICRDGVLIYQGKVKYSPGKNSDRHLFLKLLFSKPKNTLFSFKEILDFLENGNGCSLTKKQHKRILDLYRKLNGVIEKKLGIKEIFSLEKGEFESKIFRKI